MAAILTKLDPDVLQRATRIAEALKSQGAAGRWNRAEVLKAVCLPGLAQLELALGLREARLGEALEPRWSRFKP